jgi:hypothetical protein
MLEYRTIRELDHVPRFERTQTARLSTSIREAVEQVQELVAPVAEETPAVA